MHGNNVHSYISLVKTRIMVLFTLFHHADGAVFVVV